jgi:transcriptional regulator with XRE-family HTH domain
MSRNGDFMKKTKDFATVLRKQLAADPDLKAGVEEQVLQLQIGRLIHEARTASGLTQAQLAQRVGTRQSVIARMEDADYEGHSLKMLRRIAISLGRSLHVEFNLQGKARSRKAVTPTAPRESVRKPRPRAGKPRKSRLS